MAEVLRFPSPLADGNSAAALLVSDAAARASALDARSSWIVEAPAGSGKTGLLMQRLLKLLADDTVEKPEEVLAITFTRKATAELRERVLRELEAADLNRALRDAGSEFEQATRALAASVLARDRALGWSLLEDPQRLRIRTIDSLCAEIANMLPRLSDGGGAHTPVEDAKPLYRAAARRTLLQLGGADITLNQALRTVLLHRDGNLADCETLLAKMLEAREQWAELVPLERASLEEDTLDKEVRPRLEKSLQEIVCRGLRRAAGTLPGNLLRELAAMAQRLSGEPGYNGADSPIAFCSNQSKPPEARAEHLGHWLALIDLLLTKTGSQRSGFSANHLGFSLPKAEKVQLQSLIAQLDEAACDALCSIRLLPAPHYPGDQWQVSKALFRLLLRSLAELKVLFGERGECDFSELALSAREALRAEDGAEDLAASSGATLRHLLVDEMQDTSSSQYELIELLTRSWDGHSQTLFLVGDPKQSIYLFRQARVERFLRTMRDGRLGDVPVQSLRLTANFRSQAKLVDSFNRNFNRIFPSAAAVPAGEAVDVPFVEASAVRSSGMGAGVVWHTAVLGEEAPNSASVDARRFHAAEEARRIRSIVEEWQSKPLPADRKRKANGRPEPWRIAVLARVRNHLAPILAEFQREYKDRPPVPVRAVKVEALAERIEVLDALALTRALLHPADRTAWLAVLHAPWCGLGLADLLALTGEGPGADAHATVSELIAANAGRLSATGQKLLQRVWPTLQTALHVAGRDPLAVRVERTWRSLGGDATLAAHQLSNVHSFFRLLRELEQPGGRLDLSALDGQLEGLFAEPSGDEDAVQFMTIHSAKGLEWDVVLVPALERQGKAGRSELLNWLELDDGNDDTAAVILAPIHGKGGDPSRLYTWLNKVRNAREAAERKRLYYVACTRAKEELHLFAACKRNQKSHELKVPASTLLSACWAAAEEHFAALAAAPADLHSHTALAGQLTGSLSDESDGDSEPLALAAAADESAPAPGPESRPGPPMLRRLPLSFDPLRRFTDAATRSLAYTPAAELRSHAAFDRPEGSFAARAFGNVVHRFLQAVAARLADGTSADALLAELASWPPRLLASLRSEGLPPKLCRSESTRALRALSGALADPIGCWLLSPLSSAASERSLIFTAPAASSLRADRTFVAGGAPLANDDSFLWIVDFKTTQQGARSTQEFDQQERAKYTAQMETYAAIRRSLPDGDRPIMLALYYPLVPRLIHWPAPLAAAEAPGQGATAAIQPAP